LYYETQNTPRRKWEDNIKMTLQETAYEGVEWNDLAYDRDDWWVLTNTIMTLPVK
jgi:hypothetical protein